MTITGGIYIVRKRSRGRAPEDSSLTAGSSLRRFFDGGGLGHCAQSGNNIGRQLLDRLAFVGAALGLQLLRKEREMLKYIRWPFVHTAPACTKYASSECFSLWKKIQCWGSGSGRIRNFSHKSLGARQMGWYVLLVRSISTNPLEK